MIRAVSFGTVIAVLAGGDYGNACFAGLICFICKGVGVLVFVMRVVLRSPTTRADLNVSDCKAFGVVAVGVTAFPYVVVLTCALQATLGALVFFDVVNNTCIVGVVRRGYVAGTTASVNTR